MTDAELNALEARLRELHSIRRDSTPLHVAIGLAHYAADAIASLRAKLAVPVDVGVERMAVALSDQAKRLAALIYHFKIGDQLDGDYDNLCEAETMLRSLARDRDSWKASAEAAEADAGRLPFASPSDAARDVLVERMRQVSEEGWTPEHDDQHSNGCLGTAAACYALHASSQSDPVIGWQDDYRNKARRLWPFDAEWYKPSTPRRDLVRAAALILAEIERLDRAALGSAHDR